MKSREERLDRYMKVLELLPQARAELMRYPGVTDVTVGLKETASRATEAIVFRVHVKEKVPRADLPRGGMIPAEILGVPTDVVLEPRPRNTEDDEKYRPLQGGIQIGNDSSSSIGTLGCIAQRNGDRSIVLLSNRHVMLAGRELAVTSGEKIGQPYISCCCCCKGNIVGDVVNAASNGLVDCAIARVTGNPGFTNEIQDVGLVFGSAPLNAALSTVVVGDRVRKRGRTTGLTVGTVVAPLLPTPANAADGVPARTQQIQILHDPAFAHFAAAGDSGSVVVTDDNVVVGLLWGVDSTYAYANLITNVVSAMDITIINSGTPGTIPLASTPAADLLVDDAAAAGALAEIEAALAQSERGREIKALFDRHSREINDLLNDDRHVKVAWHRYQGPAYTGHVIKSAREAGHRIPPAIADVSLANLLIRMSVELQEHGSAALAAAIDRHTPPLLTLLADASSVHELLERLGDATPVGTA
jgi:phosphosulfolactate phosphohydrolase-like enzyme